MESSHTHFTEVTRVIFIEKNTVMMLFVVEIRGIICIEKKVMRVNR